MLDPFKLAELPLTTLIMVVFFYAVFQALKWAYEQYQADQARKTFVDVFDTHALLSEGVTFRAFLDLARDYNELITREPAPSPPKRNPHDPLPLRSSAPANPPAPADRDVTEGFQDLKKVAENLQMFEDDRAGLALLYVEMQALVAKGYASLNEANNSPVNAKELENALSAVLNTTAELLLITVALRDKNVRGEIAKILANPEINKNRSKVNEAFNDLFKKEVLRLATKEEHKTVVNLAVPSRPNEGHFNFATRSFEVINLSQRKAHLGNHLALPATLVGITVAIFAFSKPAQELFFGGDDETPEPSAICETSYDKNGALVGTDCSQTLNTGAVILKDGKVVAAPSSDPD